MNEKQKQNVIQAVEKIDFDLLLKQKAALAEALFFIQNDDALIQSLEWKFNNEVSQGYATDFPFQPKEVCQLLDGILNLLDAVGDAAQD